MSKLDVSFERLIDDSEISVINSPDPQPSPSPINVNSDPKPNLDPEKKVEDNPTHHINEQYVLEDRSLEKKGQDDSNKIKEGENDDPSKKVEKKEGEGKEEEGENPSSAIELFRKSLGYEVEGEFEESIDGLLDYTRRAVPLAAQQILGEIFEEYPQAEELIRHLKDGRSIDTFVEQYKKPDFLKVQITKDSNPEVLERVIRENLSQKGLDQEEIDLHINYAKDSNKLFEISQKNYQQLEQRRQSEVQAMQDNEKAELARVQQNRVETWNKVNELVNSGRVANTIIPDVDKVKFLEFISKPVTDDGLTARQVRQKEMGVEEHLYLDYLIFKDATKKNGSPTQQKDEIFERLMGSSRKQGRLDNVGISNTKTQSSKIANPKESLKGLNFNNLIQ